MIPRVMSKYLEGGVKLSGELCQTIGRVVSNYLEGGVERYVGGWCRNIRGMVSNYPGVASVYNLSRINL